MSKGTLNTVKDSAFGLGLLLLIAPSYSTTGIIFTIILLGSSLIVSIPVVFSLFKSKKTQADTLITNLKTQTIIFAFLSPVAFIAGTIMHQHLIIHRGIYTGLCLGLLVLLIYFMDKHLAESNPGAGKGKGTKKSGKKTSISQVLYFYVIFIVIAGVLFYISS